MSTGDTSGAVRVAADGWIVREGGECLNIPIEKYLWPEQQRRHRTFELTPAHIRYVRRFGYLPWIDRARSEAFWQCRACGFKPWPVPVYFCAQPVLDVLGDPMMDDSVWEWFTSLPLKIDKKTGIDSGPRAQLVLLSAEIRRFNREIKSARRSLSVGEHGMREIEPNCR